MSKRCRVVADTAAGILSCELTLASDATLAAALVLTRAQLPHAAIDWERVSVGVFGQVQPRSHVPQDGDRIELYRPLPHDPRAARRARVQQARGG